MSVKWVIRNPLIVMFMRSRSITNDLVIMKSLTLPLRQFLSAWVISSFLYVVALVNLTYSMIKVIKNH